MNDTFACLPLSTQGKMNVYLTRQDARALGKQFCWKKQCDQIEQFLIVLGDNFFQKEPKGLATFLALWKNITF